VQNLIPKSVEQFYGDGCTMVWWLALSPHSKRVPGSNPCWGLSVWSLHVLPVHAWVLFRNSGFLPPPQNMPVWLCMVVCDRVALWWTGNPSPLAQWQLGWVPAPLVTLNLIKRVYIEWMDGTLCGNNALLALNVWKPYKISYQLHDTSGSI